MKKYTFFKVFQGIKENIDIKLLPEYLVGGLYTAIESFEESEVEKILKLAFEELEKDDQIIFFAKQVFEFFDDLSKKYQKLLFEKIYQKYKKSRNINDSKETIAIYQDLIAVSKDFELNKYVLKMILDEYVNTENPISIPREDAQLILLLV
ncbi:hypothetical protein ACFL15_01655 [Patescibacteria group bacterium]